MDAVVIGGIHISCDCSENECLLVIECIVLLFLLR